jgi:SAM-dependent methyltransferase
MPPSSHRPVAAGLFLVTLATLVLEILDSRLLSVVTWYHLAFLAVSLAMLGMAGGAVYVFLRGEAYTGARAREALPRYSLWLALSIPVSHIANLSIPIPVIERVAVMDALSLALSTVVLAAPFVLSGIIVTIALTRTDGPIGKLYAADLIGAALGCVLVIPLLNTTNISSVALVAGAAAAAAAFCFQQYAGGKGVRRASLVLATGLLMLAGWNATTSNGIGVMYPKNRQLWARDVVQWSAWNTHSYVVVSRPTTGPAFYWGPGAGSERFTTTFAWMVIDGEAGTPITQWDGDRNALEWVQYDITAAPYYLRRGDAAIIGVGGGRDVLSAIWGESSSVTGIEINNNLLYALQGPYREFAGIANRPEVSLVHSEARSYLSRIDRRFDVLQMSLIDTWAATGAGAFTLTENGLYTLEAWRVFLDRLKPGGVFSVSRWYAPSEISETSRLVALAVGSLLDRGIRSPADHLIMLSRAPVATLLVSNQPFTADDRTTIERLARERGFQVVLSPWTGTDDRFLNRIVRSASPEELAAATDHPMFDFSPPTDARPFFFNTLKPASFSEINNVGAYGVIAGNMRATWTLVLLFVIAVMLVIAIIVYPLMRAGLPTMDGGTFAMSLSYFAFIGAGYMLIQIPLLQRFSVYLGHPTYTFAIILFTMILFTGFGSLISDRFPVERHSWVLKIPLAIGAGVLLLMLGIQPLIERTIQFELPARSLIVILCTAPIALLLGFCFPLGMTLVGRLSADATAWMWGVNGACGVLASIAAVGISMWLGIDTNLLAAGLAYTLLLIPALGLARRARVRQSATASAYSAPAASDLVTNKP